MSQILTSFTWLDALDILIVAFVIYRVMLLVKGTRAEQMLWGLAIITLAYFISRGSQLLTLQWILSNLLGSIIIIIIVIFQNDIRRALIQVGKRPPFFSGSEGLEDILDEVVKATFSLSEKRNGALIVLERDVGLKDYIETGVEVDARVTSQLLVSIFSPSSPLHDGAVVIQHGRLTRASCFLPLTANHEVGITFGTRHRAALGLAEETDAVVIVVSEETGEVSLVVDGVMYHQMDPPRLKGSLLGMFRKEEGRGLFWRILGFKRIED
ncbi:MAG: TIGR00159 family protein [Deltaproteobacteria bacterium]|nr:TIGR00159 family protein [Deltaproteobacteria bacterium]